MLATGLIVGYGYLMEVFFSWYSASQYEWYVTINRALGPYAPVFWALILANVVIVQLFWFRSVRSNPILLFIISLVINIGMWLERFVIIVISLHRDFIPAAWGGYQPTVWDWSLYLGTIGLFFALLFLFIRLLPMISIFEMRELVAEEQEEQVEGAVGESP
jgi:molybdopterin-containing oxidoreductase family membrane subunit